MAPFNVIPFNCVFCRWLEADRRSLHSISPLSQRKASSDPPPTGDAPALGHSRHGSLSSQVSSLSASSSSSNPPMEEGKQLLMNCTYS